MAGEEKESDRRRVTSIRAYIKALSKRSEQRVIFTSILSHFRMRLSFFCAF
jgi:hypothetical protein